MNRKPAIQIIVLMMTILFASTVFSPVVQSVPPIQQETLIVDPAGGGDYTTIRDAIDNASVNAVIEVKEGAYKESNLEISKKLTIIGNAQTDTIINCEGNNGFILESSYITIKNLKLINTGKCAISIRPESDWCNITQCSIETSSNSIGIQITASSALVSGCNIAGFDNTATGIEIREHNNIVRDCNIHGFGVAILTFIGAYDNEIVGCNLFNNQNAIDIRINSHDNVVSECNIYANDMGVYIWQNSDHNSVYLNNFWRNDVDATDVCNNTWDNGIRGNYWSKYVGPDVDGDGIGDTSYTISGHNVDRFPLASMILPSEITVPTNLRITGNSWDNTPSFTWAPSVYSNGVKGYYVRIDNNPDMYVGDTTSWTSVDSVSNGSHTFYVCAEGDDTSSSEYSSITFSIDVTFIDTDSDGWSDQEEQKYGTDINDPDNYPLDTDNDNLPNSVDEDDDNDGYSDDMEGSYGTNVIDPDSYPVDTDADKIPNDDSFDRKYVGDVDDDDDYLEDAIEIKLGSDPLDETDVDKIYLSGKNCYLVDTSQNKVFDILYNPITDTTSSVEKYNGNYLIDKDGDGSWDYIYTIADGSISRYGEQTTTLWVLALVAIFILLLAAIYYVKNRSTYFIKRKFKRNEAGKKLKKMTRPLEKPSQVYAFDKETAKMMDQTKILLQNIQQDVVVYMNKVDQMEKQIALTSLKSIEIDKRHAEDEIDLEEKEIKTFNLETKVDQTVVEEIGKKVDMLLNGLDNQND